MYSKYFLMSPLQKRRGMLIYTQHRKKGTSNPRNKYKKRETPKKKNRSEIKSVLFPHSSQHKNVSPY